MEKALQTFSPREVQARVRAGESPDVIAAESGWPMDKVMRYAEPLLAEREFIAQQAQTVEVRRSGGGATLLESAYAVIGIDPEAGAIDWDAYRREDGKWIVTAEYTDADGSHQGRWTYDHAGRNLHPLDDEARTLLGVRPAVGPDVDIAEALDLVAEVPVAREPEARPRLVAVPNEPEEPDVAIDADETPARTGADSQETVALAHPSLLDDAPADTAPGDAEPTPQPTPPKQPAAKTPAKKPKARRGRASVPSWDEILFGATKQDD